MADSTNIVSQNVTGRFFVDTSCIYCELCTETAPSIFKESKEDGWAYVAKQPQTDDELAYASEALEGCPTGSIGAENYDPKWREFLYQSK